MKKSSKLALACAVGAVAILLATGLARCAMAPQPDMTEEDEQQAAEEIGWENYLNSTWQSVSDKDAQLSLIDGALVETKGSEVRIVYLEVTGSAADKTGITVQVSTQEKLNEPSKEGVIRIDVTAEKETLTADCLKYGPSYIKIAAPDQALTIANGTAKLEEAMSTPAEQLQAAIAAHASKVSPYATSAIWDQEVFVDYGKGIASTTFTLNDTAHTIVTVTVDSSSGEIGAL